MRYRSLTLLGAIVASLSCAAATQEKGAIHLNQVGFYPQME